MLEEVIKWVNDQKASAGSTEPNVVLGQSMGGLIARYALADMEQDNDPTTNHDTSLYISHDAPHQGAHLPVGILHMGRHVANEFLQTPLGSITIPINGTGSYGLGTIHDLLDAPAVNQMLINSVDANGNRTDTAHTNWQNELKLMGYPQQTRNIALSNASHCGNSQGLFSNQEIVTVAGGGGTSVLTSIIEQLLINIDPIIGVALNDLSTTLLGFLPGNSNLDLEFRANTFPSSGTARIYKGRLTYEKKFLWLFPITRTIFNTSKNSQSGDKFIDNYPGGVTPNGLAISDTGGDSNWFYNYDYDLNVNLNLNFIPVTSALDVGSGNVVLNNNDYFRPYNAVNPPTGNRTIPFDNFTSSFNTSGTNESHISFNRRNGNWLATELDDNPLNQEIFDCSFSCFVGISGTDELCSGSRTFVATPGADSYQWFVSSTGVIVNVINPVNSNIMSLTRIGNKSGWVTVSVKINSERCGVDNLVIKKRVYVGAPTVDTVEAVSLDLVPQINFNPNLLNSSEVALKLNFAPDNYATTDIEWEKVTADVAWSRDNTSYNDRYVVLYPTCNKLFKFRVRAYNDCAGWSEWQDLEYNITECSRSCPQEFSGIVSDNLTLYPVPTSNVINIKVNASHTWILPVIGGGNNGGIDGSVGSGSNNSTYTNPNFSLNVSFYNSMGILVYTTTTIGIPTQVDISHLISGAYMMVVEHRGQIESHSIVKN